MEAIIDSVGPRFDWPVTFSAAIVIAEPIAANTLLSRGRTLIYSRYSFKILQLLKSRRGSGLLEGSEVVAFALGGSVRFPSGHLKTFLLVGDGFPEIGKRYAIFLSKLRDSKAYILGMAFLLEGDSAFSIDGLGSREAMPRQEFETQLRLAIKNNVNVQSPRVAAAPARRLIKYLDSSTRADGTAKQRLRFERNHSIPIRLMIRSTFHLPVTEGHAQGIATHQQQLTRGLALLSGSLPSGAVPRTFL